MAKVPENLASAKLKLHWADERHNEMVRTFEAFIQEGDKEPYWLHFDGQPKPQGLFVVRFLILRDMPSAMSLLAGDCVHNTRVALDHTLTGLKHVFGGNVGSGSFPVCLTRESWERRLTGRANPLKDLHADAVRLIFAEQPFNYVGEGGDPKADPLATVHALDNDDKHEMLRPAFAYPDVSSGAELIKVTDRSRVQVINVWNAGQPLEHQTVLARCLVRGSITPSPVHADRDQPMGFAIGRVDRYQIAISEMVSRVRGIVARASALIESHTK